MKALGAVAAILCLAVGFLAGRTFTPRYQLVMDHGLLIRFDSTSGQGCYFSTADGSTVKQAAAEYSMGNLAASQKAEMDLVMQAVPSCGK